MKALLSTHPKRWYRELLVGHISYIPYLMPGSKASKIKYPQSLELAPSTLAADEGDRICQVWMCSN